MTGTELKTEIYEKNANLIKIGCVMVLFWMFYCNRQGLRKEPSLTEGGLLPAKTRYTPQFH